MQLEIRSGDFEDPRFRLYLSAPGIAVFLIFVGVCVLWQDIQDGGRIGVLLETYLGLRTLCPPVTPFSRQSALWWFLFGEWREYTACAGRCDRPAELRSSNGPMVLLSGCEKG